MQTGLPLIKTVGFDGTHGVAVAGMHGAFVTNPRVEAIIEITSGLVGAEQSPKLGILAKGKKSFIFKFIFPELITVFGKALMGTGIVPKEQEQIAP